MKLFRTPAATVLAIAAMVAPQAAQAARMWLLPSETMFAGSGDEWLTIDAAVSTDLYYFDHQAQAWEPKAYAPDGSEIAVENSAKGRLRLTFDVHLTQRGTYKVAIVNEMVMGNYLLNGERKMLPRGTTPATLAQAIPAGATDVMTAENITRVETFASAGEPTTGVFKTTGKGIEMVPVTHPNDLAVGEPATFQFLLDGKPAANLDVSAIAGGVRYRTGLTQVDLKTDAQGKVTIKWPEPGMYWVSVSTGGGRGPAGPGGSRGPGGPGAPGAGAPGATAPQVGGAPPPAPMGPPQRRASYAMTVEVLD